MPLPRDDLIAVLRCPVTRSALRPLGLGELRSVNARIKAGKAAHRDGTPVRRALDSALINRDGSCIYPIDDDVIILLKELAIDGGAGEGGSESTSPAPDELCNEKRVVQRFYDEVGWTRGEQGVFADAEKFEDLRPVARDYIHRCHMRVNRYLPPRGRFLLDAASGPIQYPEYLTYSSGYDLRVCVDISLVALRAARQKLGDKGAYLLADVADLPLMDGSMDSFVSLHTLYHVPRDEQKRVVRELHRALRPGSSGVLVYTWGVRSPLMRLAFLPGSILRKLIRLPAKLFGAVSRVLERGGPEVGSPPPDLYFYAHDHGFFAKTDWDFGLDLRVWRAASVEFTSMFARDLLGGRQLLKLVYWLEEQAPYLAGRYGQYPLFVIRK